MAFAAGAKLPAQIMKDLKEVRPDDFTAKDFITREEIATAIIESAAAYDRVTTTQADSVATDVATLQTDFNGLLGKLKTAGLMASS